MANIYCKTVANNQVGFYMQANGKEYFLCKQRYYRTLWDYFVGGVDINSLFSKGGKHSHAVRKVKLKLPAYIEYVEREQGVLVLDKTLSRNGRVGAEKRRKSKDCTYNWRNEDFDDIA